MKRKPIHPMSLEELEKLSTKQLLARLRQLHQCEESALLSDRDDASNASGTIMFKDTPEWKAAYKQVKGTLSVREQVPKGAELAEKRIPSARQLDTLKRVSSWRAEGIQFTESDSDQTGG